MSESGAVGFPLLVPVKGASLVTGGLACKVGGGVGAAIPRAGCKEDGEDEADDVVDSCLWCKWVWMFAGRAFCHGLLVADSMLF